MLLNCALLCGSLLGFATLALSMPRHARQLLGGPLPGPRQHMLRASGWLLLAFTLALGIQRLQWDAGIVAWLGWLSVAGIVVAFSLPYWPFGRHRH